MTSRVFSKVHACPFLLPPPLPSQAPVASLAGGWQPGPQAPWSVQVDRVMMCLMTPPCYPELDPDPDAMRSACCVDRSPYRSPFSATGGTPTKASRPADASTASSPELQGHSLELCPDTEVQATISGLEKAGVGEDGPLQTWACLQINFTSIFHTCSHGVQVTHFRTLHENRVSNKYFAREGGGSL